MYTDFFLFLLLLQAEITMASIQAAVKEHIQGKLREIGNTLDEERRELSVRFLL